MVKSWTKKKKYNFFKSLPKKAHIHNTQSPNGQKDYPVCVSSRVDYMVKHILTEWLKIEDSRKKHHTTHLLGEALQPNSNQILTSSTS